MIHTWGGGYTLEEMCGMSISLIFAIASIPYVVTNEGDLRVTLPTGVVLVIPEGSEFTINSHETRLDSKTVVLDNARIFGDGFE